MDATAALETTPKTESHLTVVREAVATPSARLLVDEAIRWMRVAHRGQRRPDGSGTPYVEHPAAVAHLVATHVGTRDPQGRLRVHDAALLVAALLHDTVEDQAARTIELAQIAPFVGDARYDERRVALEGIAARFGADVARLVGLLTAHGIDAGDLAARGLATGAIEAAVKAQLYRAHVLTLLAYEPRAAVVKLADLSTNALALGGVPPGGKREKLRLKYRPTLIALTTELAQLPEGHPALRWAPTLRRHIDDALAGPYADDASG
jgi:(p)ppGpp synthase/HD superfamily hydrolase